MDASLPNQEWSSQYKNTGRAVMYHRHLSNYSTEPRTHPAGLLDLWQTLFAQEATVRSSGRMPVASPSLVRQALSHAFLASDRGLVWMRSNFLWSLESHQRYIMSRSFSTNLQSPNTGCTSWFARGMPSEVGAVATPFPRDAVRRWVDPSVFH